MERSLEQFKLNCERWSQSNSETAALLSTQVFKNKQVIDSLDDARAWVASQNIGNFQVIFIYGVGSGALYKALHHWKQSDPERVLVFIEDDLEVLYHLFSTEVATEILHDRQARIIYLDPEKPVFKQFATSFGVKSFTILPSDYYSKTKGEKFSQLSALISFYMDLQMAIPKEYGDFGKRFFSNYFRNLLHLPESAYGNRLFGKFSNIPAIICGAGPSLGKDLELLKTVRDRALIFAAGTAMNALNSAGILPHFGACIDPNTAQFTRLVMNDAFEVPYFYRNRVLNDALKLIHGQHLYITGSGGYQISDWVEDELGMTERRTVEEGCSVMNFSLALAYALGCNPIILTGMDLAYTDDNSYSPGIHNHPIHLRKKYFITKSPIEDVISKNDIYGKPTKTLWKWVGESFFVSNFHRHTPEVAIINATQGGIGFYNVPNMPLQHIKEAYLQKQYDLDGMVQAEISGAKLPESVTIPHIKKVINTLLESLEKSLELCQTNDLEALENEIAFKFLLKVFSEKYVEMHGHDFEVLRYEAEELGPSEIEKGLKELEKGRLSFLERTAATSQEVLNEVLKQEINDPGKPLILKASSEKPFTIDPAATRSSEYFPSGKLKHEEYRLNDLLHGPSTYYSEEGNVLSRHHFSDGKLEGNSYSYSLEGALIAQNSYCQGDLHGVQNYYYPDGKQKSFIPYKKGLLHGKVQLFYPDGKIQRELFFVDGMRHGPERILNEAGKLIIEAEFDQDAPKGTARQWHPNGQLALEIIYEHDPKNFVLKEWDANGNPILVDPSIILDYFSQAAMYTETLSEPYQQHGKPGAFTRSPFK